MKTNIKKKRCMIVLIAGSSCVRNNGLHFLDDRISGCNSVRFPVPERIWLIGIPAALWVEHASLQARGFNIVYKCI
jgi:hypothetical protein